MNTQDYQKQAMWFSSPYIYESVNAQLINGALGLCGESGEIADLLKKHLYQGHALDRVKVKEELGDLLWYIALICHTLEINISDVMEGNITKLTKRYPNGFSTENSLRREK